MSRTVAVPDFGDSGSLHQHVEVAEPGDPGYPTPMLPEGDPWASAVNRAVAAVRAEAEPYADHAAPVAEQMLNGPWPDPEPEAEL